MNVYQNSDILPESAPSIIKEPAYRIEKYLVDEVFWIGWGDDHVMRDFEMLGEFQDRASAWACYNKNKTGIRDIRMIEIQRYPDGHIEYARIGGAV